MSEQPGMFTAPESGRYHVVSGQEPHLARDCTGQCPAADPVMTGGSMKAFEENWPAVREIIAATGSTAAEANAAAEQTLAAFKAFASSLPPSDEFLADVDNAIRLEYRAIPIRDNGSR